MSASGRISELVATRADSGPVFAVRGLLRPTSEGPDVGPSQTSPVTEWDFDDAGQLVSVTDPLSRETTFEDDDNGNRTSVTLPDPDGAGSQTAPEITFAYDALNRRISSTDPLSNVTLFGYDINSRLVKQTDPDPDGGGSLTSPVTEWDYDDAGQLVTLTNAAGEETTYEYDDPGRLTKTTLPDPDGGGAQAAPEYTQTYDIMGNILSQDDALDNTTSYEYDNLYRVTKITDANAAQTTFTYDAAGRRKTLTDPEGNETEWFYDNTGRMTSEVNELNETRSRTYDTASNITLMRDRNGQDREFTYDDLHRLLKEEWDNGVSIIHTIDYTYDAASQLTNVTDDNSEYDFTYDDLGRVTEIDNTDTPDAPAVILTMAYDAANRRTSLAAEIDSTDDFLNTYSFDNLGRLTQVDQDEQSGGNSVSEKRVDFAYNDLGQFDTITRYADLSGTLDVATSEFTYDDMNRLTALDHKQGTTVLSDYDWTFDSNGRLTSVTTVDGTDDYTYDDTGQLTDVDSDYQTDESYTYDDNGNRTNTGYTTGSNNQLTSDGTYNYEYDDEGNRTKKTTISTGAYVEYDWDHRNRLTTVTFKTSGGTKTKQVTYVYDAFDRRIARDVDSDGNGTFDSGERYAYDAPEFQAGIGGPLVDPTRAFGWVDDIILVFDDSGTFVERILHGPTVDLPLATEDGSGDVLWLLADHQGTIKDVAEYDSGTDTTTVVNHIQYGAFGNITSQSNSSYEPRHTYTGREWDPHAELYYYRARWYDPDMGRFISEDPIGFAAGDVNLVRHTRNNASNATDPSGLDEADEASDETPADMHPIIIVNRSPIPIGNELRDLGHIDLIVPGRGMVGFYPTNLPVTTSVFTPKQGVLNNTVEEFHNGPAARPLYLRTTSKIDVVAIMITDEQLKLLQEQIDSLDKDPPTFNTLTSNCAQNACRLLHESTILPPDEPYSLTPHQLQEQLVKLNDGIRFPAHVMIDPNDADGDGRHDVIVFDENGVIVDFPNSMPGR